MASFKIFKHWRRTITLTSPINIPSSSPISFPELRLSSPETCEGEAEDDGPFFDLQLAMSDNQTTRTLEINEEDDLNFSIISSHGTEFEIESDSKPQFAVSFLKSAIKFRVFISGLRKHRSTAPKQHGKFFFIKFKTDEVPIISLFTRDASSRKMSDEEASEEKSSSSAKESKKTHFSKFKPFRHADKLGGSCSSIPMNFREGKESESERFMAVKTEEKNETEGITCERQGKTWSSSSSLSAAPYLARRRDDSLLQQQDGIQSAIAHCKRSFTTSL